MANQVMNYGSAGARAELVAGVPCLGRYALQALRDARDWIVPAPELWSPAAGRELSTGLRNGCVTVTGYRPIDGHKTVEIGGTVNIATVTRWSY